MDFQQIVMWDINLTNDHCKKKLTETSNDCERLWLLCKGHPLLDKLIYLPFLATVSLNFYMINTI